MNRRSLLGSVAASFGLGNSALAAAASFVMDATPKPMPELQFIDHDGRALTLKDFSGKTLLLNLWATWCAPCRKEMPALDRLQVALGGPNFMVLPVSIDRKGFTAVDVFYVDASIQHLSAYVAPAANQALDTLGIWGLPASLLIDPQGRELARLEGPAEWDAPEMIDFLKTIIAKQKETTP